VPGRADRVQEQLAGELGQVEAGAHLGAVDGDAGGALRHLLLPGRQLRAAGVEQAQPQPQRPGPVARPVVGGDEAGGKASRFAEEAVVGGKIQPVEIAARIGEQRGVQPCLV